MNIIYKIESYLIECRGKIYWDVAVFFFDGHDFCEIARNKCGELNEMLRYLAELNIKEIEGLEEE